MSIWDICLPSNAFRLMQCPSNVSTLHVESFLWYGGTILKNLHGWFLHLRRFIYQYLHHLELVLQYCAEKTLTLNWEKCHFMIRHGIILRHEISKKGIEVDRAKIEVISKLPMPKCMKDIWSFLGHAGFYRRFIKDFSKIARPLTNLLAKDMPFTFDAECINSWRSLKERLFLYQSYQHRIGLSHSKLCATLLILP